MDYRGYWNPSDCLTSQNAVGLQIVGEYYVEHTPPYLSTVKSRTSDPEYDPIDNIMSRLDDYKLYGGGTLINLSCDCELTNQKPANYSYSSSDSESSSESDEEDLPLHVLLKMLKNLEEKSTSPNKAIFAIVESFHCHDNITETELQEIWNMLQTDNIVVKELVLKLICKLCLKGDNSKLFIEKGLLNLMRIKMLHSQYAQIQTAAVLVLESVISHISLKSKWIDHITPSLIQLIINNTKSDKSLDFKYAVCRFFKMLVHYEEFITIVLEDAIPVIQVTVDTYSDKLKVMLLDILHTLVIHGDILPPEFVEASVIPVTVEVIRDGPCEAQCRGLKLLATLTKTDVGVSSVISCSVPVVFALCCISQSKCRNARSTAMEVLGNISRTRRIGLCKELMTLIASYLCPDQLEGQAVHSPRDAFSSGVENGCHRNMSSPWRPGSSLSYYQKEGLLWKGLEQLVSTLAEIFSREALVEKNDKGESIGVTYKPGIDASWSRLGILKQTIIILQNICMWPTGKSRHDISKINLNNFTDDPNQRLRLSKINRSLTQLVWDAVGFDMVDLLFIFSKELATVVQYSDKSKHCTDVIQEEQTDDIKIEQITVKVKGQNMAIDFVKSLVNSKGQVTIEILFEEEEIQLINTLLEFVLCVSLCSCKDFMNLMPKEEKTMDKSTTINKPGKITQSDSAIAKSRPSSAKLRSRSVSAMDRTSEDLTPRFHRHTCTSVSEKTSDVTKDHQTVTKDHQTDLMEKEINTERRLLRKCLYESGIISCISPFINCTDTQCQMLALEIIRCNIQPLQERVASRIGGSSHNRRTRPQSAKTPADIHEVERRLNKALDDMSPDLSAIILDALGPRPQPKIELDNTSALSQVKNVNLTPRKKVRRRRPKIDPSQPIAHQCRDVVLTECSHSLLDGLFNVSVDCKKQTILVIQDLVYYGEKSIHSKLNELGGMKRLLEFLRINTDDELLEVVGLIIVQMLLVSDHRLKSVFDRYGGTRLLTYMVQYTSGLLKQEATKTLQTLTKDIPKKRLRPKSAPVGRSTSIETNTVTADIWDQIQQRWTMEDRVTEVLQQWSK